MPSYYCVVRYLPSALAEEFVNIGVVTFGDGRVRSRFVEDYRRARIFAGHRVRAALEIQREFESGMFDEEAVRRTTREWAGSVQLSDPRASTLDPDALLDRVAGMFLHAAASRQRAVNRLTVARHAVATLRDAIRERLPLLGAQLLFTEEEIPGSIRPREFDIVVRNGVPLHAAQAFSFRLGDQANVLRQVEAATVAFRDATERSTKLKSSALLLPPASPSLEYDAAVRTLERADIKVVTSANEQSWADAVADHAAKYLLAQ